MQEANVASSGLAHELENTGSGTDTTWRFLCECGDSACKERVELELAAYEAIHSSSCLVLALGHTGLGGAIRSPRSSACT